LRRECFVVRDNEGRPLKLANHICDRERLTRAGHAKQRLMPVAGLDGFNQLGDRLSLITARFVVRFELKRHWLK